MTQHVTEHDVRDIAEYTRIGLTDEEVSQMTVDLNAIIDSLAAHHRVRPGRAWSPRSTPSAACRTLCATTWRRPSFTQEEALENAPKQQDGCFLIPSILGEGGDR